LKGNHSSTALWDTEVPPKRTQWNQWIGKAASTIWV